MLSGIILAAGESHRMGKTIKALLQINDTSFIEYIINLMSKAPIDELIVVLGAHHEKLLEKIKNYPVKIVYNDNWPEGQISSLRVGIHSLSPLSEAVMFTLVDHPFVLQSTYNKLYNEWLKDKTRIVLPSYHMRKGHPAIFPSALYKKILNQNLKHGARDLLEQYRNLISYVLVDDEGTVRDIDTIEDYQTIINKVK